MLRIGFAAKVSTFRIASLKEAVSLLDRRSTVYSWLMSDARTPVWLTRWCLSGQGVVLKRLWMENLAG